MEDKKTKRLKVAHDLKVSAGKAFPSEVHFSMVDGCPLDAIMKESKVLRWVAIAEHLTAHGSNFKQVGIDCSPQRGPSHIRRVAARAFKDGKIERVIARHLKLPVEQVFPDKPVEQLVDEVDREIRDCLIKILDRLRIPYSPTEGLRSLFLKATMQAGDDAIEAINKQAQRLRQKDDSKT